MIEAVYRASPADAWVDCEVIGRRWPEGAYVLREVGTALPGVWLGSLDQVRIPRERNELRAATDTTSCSLSTHGGA